jgi:hypothetical protein
LWHDEVTLARDPPHIAVASDPRCGGETLEQRILGLGVERGGASSGTMI